MAGEREKNNTKALGILNEHTTPEGSELIPIDTIMSQWDGKITRVGLMAIMNILVERGFAVSEGRKLRNAVKFYGITAEGIERLNNPPDPKERSNSKRFNVMQQSRKSGALSDEWAVLADSQGLSTIARSAATRRSGTATRRKEGLACAIHPDRLKPASGDAFKRTEKMRIC